MALEYSAGRTNIGTEEIRYRRLTQGWGGLALAVALFVIIYFLNFSFFVYLTLFIPIYISVAGFYQANEEFCIAYGKTGVCNLSGSAGETRDVIGRLNRNKDKQKANKMMLISIAGSAVATLLVAYVSTR